jgi:hypothetical protein
MKLNSQQLKLSNKWWRYLPALGVGTAIFYFNSFADFNYWAKGYLTILEIQTVFVVAYLWLRQNKR